MNNHMTSTINFSIANEYFKKKEYKNAIELYKKILENSEFKKEWLTKIIKFNIKYAEKKIKQIEKPKDIKIKTQESTVIKNENKTEYRLKLEQEMLTIEKYFDREYYLNKNKDVLNAKVDPLEHFCSAGWREGRNPNSNFSTKYYIDSNPDIEQAKINPFWHYIVAGKNEGRECVHPGGFKAEELKKITNLEEIEKQWIKKINHEKILKKEEILNEIQNYSITFNKKIIFSIGHDNYLQNAGGIQICIKQEQRKANEYGFIYINISPSQPLPKLANDEDKNLLINLIINGKWIGVTGYNELYESIKKIKNENNIDIKFIAHSFLGHSLEQIKKLLSIGNGYSLVWTHDFFTLCPSYALQRNTITFCNAPEIKSNSCQICVYGEERKSHLNRINNFINSMNIKIISPSEVALNYWLSKINFKFNINNCIVAPHLDMQWKIEKNNYNVKKVNTQKINIGFIGYPVNHKGWNIFEEIANKYRANEKFQFTYIGTETPSNQYIKHIKFNPNSENYLKSVEHLKKNEFDYILHWGSCYETFSFTAHETIAIGALILTHKNTGNVAELVVKHKFGIVFEDITELNNYLDSDELLKNVIHFRNEKFNKLVDLKFTDISLPYLN